MWRQYNPNPQQLLVGDCVIRAVSCATGHTWQETYAAITAEGYKLCDMPSANREWGHYLTTHGFARCWLPDECPACYTVAQFADEHPSGVYVLALDGHVVTVKGGDWWDSWDSRDRVPLYYFERS